MFEASVRMVEAHAGDRAMSDDSGDSEDEDADAMVRRERRQAKAEAARRRGGEAAASGSSPGSSRRRSTARDMSAADATSALARKGVTLDARPFGTFVRALSLRDVPVPREKKLPWCMRIIEELYDERYKREQELVAEEDRTGAPLVKKDRPFPLSVVEFVKKRYGLPAIIDQNCIDLLFNTVRKRRAVVDCELFARFLEEHYSEDELLFFLYVRSIAQKVLGNVSFRTMWSELGRAGSGVSKPRLDVRQCSHIARIVFASESDPHYLSFMANVKDAAAAAGSLDVGDVLRLAMEDYHDTVAGDDDEDGFGEADDGRDAARTDQLVAEADRDFEGRRRAGGAGRTEEAADAAASDERRTLLERLSATLQQTNEEYVEQLLDQVDGLDDEAAEEMRGQLVDVLAEAVDGILMQAINDTERGTKAVSADVNPIGARFYDVLGRAGDGSSDEEVADRIQALCSVVIDSHEVGVAMEPAVKLLMEASGSADDEADDE